MWNLYQISLPAWEVFFIILIFQMAKLWCIEMLMVAFPQDHPDRATYSERAQNIHGSYGCFQNSIFQNTKFLESWSTKEKHFIFMGFANNNYIDKWCQWWINTIYPSDVEFFWWNEVTLQVSLILRVTFAASENI